jgi:hypothetical protein
MAQSHRRNAYSAQMFHRNSGYSKANSSNSYTRMINTCSSSAFINTAKTAADTVIGSIRTGAKMSQLLSDNACSAHIGVQQPFHGKYTTETDYVVER